VDRHGSYSTEAVPARTLPGRGETITRFLGLVA
jgi:hypothetical protein